MQFVVFLVEYDKVHKIDKSFDISVPTDVQWGKENTVSLK